MHFVLQLKDGVSEKALATVEEMLKYSTEGNRTLKALFERLIVEFDRVEHCTVAKKMLQYYEQRENEAVEKAFALGFSTGVSLTSEAFLKK